MSRKRRRVVLLIVEGPSDETALEQSFAAFFDPDEVMIKVVHGDVTAEANVGPSNVASAVGDLVKAWASRYGLGRSDFIRVIHVVDSDGAYVPDANVIEDVEHVGRPVYAESCIIASPTSRIKERNVRKRANLDRLSSLAAVWGSVPYSVHYMSCNLDHVLHGEANADDAAKRANAYRFATKYRDDLDGFVRFIADPAVAVPGDYGETWDYIRQGLNSLQRHSNLHLCFRRERPEALREAKEIAADETRTGLPPAEAPAELRR